MKWRKKPSSKYIYKIFIFRHVENHLYCTIYLLLLLNFTLIIFSCKKPRQDLAFVISNSPFIRSGAVKKIHLKAAAAVLNHTKTRTRGFCQKDWSAKEKLLSQAKTLTWGEKSKGRRSSILKVVAGSPPPMPLVRNI